MACLIFDHTSSKLLTDSYYFQPICYGYQYLYAVDAIDDNGVPDIEVFQEYFSDLSDDKLALQLSDIIHDCSEPILAKNTSFSKLLSLHSVLLEG